MTEWNTGPDPADQRAAEELDEDSLRVDPLEQGIEPPEHWTGADKYGMTPAEALDGEGLERKLAAERPDVLPEVAGRPVANTPVDELDETIDDLDEPAGYEMPEPAYDSLDDAARRGQSADEAGGSMAEAIRSDEPLDDR
ncbi:hypothetical protein [Actinokineospora sp. HUAS TT18]|uniref:hypothetical protein n=1 Tax=Actinokineospora sp. HUAS TT18 TaxID=3447451 RepID=UPI003F52387F